MACSFRILSLASVVVCLVALESFVNAAQTLASDDQRALGNAQKLMVQKYSDIVSRVGATQAALLEQRIDTEIGEVASPDPPPGFSMADWMMRLHNVTMLDTSLVDQLASGKPLPVQGSKGLVERLFQSTVDRTLQPYALYVPAVLPAHPSLVVLLHGNPQTEAEILGAPYFRTLADSTGTIIAAPWARGIGGYFPPADTDVYQVADQVAAAYDVPASATYLAGYSNGGYSVFKIGPKQAARWTGIMCISGSLVNSETQSVGRAFSGKRVYVINGADDDEVPAAYGARTAGWLVGAGIQTGFYQAPKGTHYLLTLLPELTRAWHDMLANRIDDGAQQAARAQGSRSTAPETEGIGPMNGVRI